MSESYDELMKEGQKDLNQGRAPLAIDEFKKAIKLMPHISDPYYMATVSLLQWSIGQFQNKLGDEGVDLHILFQDGISPSEALKASSVDSARLLASNATQRLMCVKYEGARLTGISLLRSDGLKWITKAAELNPSDNKIMQLHADIKEMLAEPTAKMKGCYIATACYESYDHPDVLEFRRYRDEILLPTTIGRMFVALYYKISPPIAHRIGHIRWLSNIIRKWFLEPLARKLR